MFLKRLVAFIVSLTVIINLCVIDIYADEEQSYLDWLKQACTNIGDLIDGNITTDEFLSRSSDLVVNPQNIPSMALNTYTQIQDSIRSFSSDMLPQDFYNFVGKIASPLFETRREYVKKSTHIADGYDAVFIRHLSSGEVRTYYCHYIVLTNYDSFLNGSSNRFTVVLYAPIYYVNDSTLSESGSFSFNLIRHEGEWYEFYGNVLNGDNGNTPVEGTEDTYIDVPYYNFDDDSSADLIELLNRFNEALKMQQPDFSSIEGILQAIYYQCTGINSKMITYDQCNSLIMSLIASGDSNTQEIVNVLLELREDMKNNQVGNDGKDDEGDSGDQEGSGSSPEKEIAGTLYNVKPLDKNFFQNLVTDKQNLRVEYEGKVYYLEDDGTLELDGKYYYVDMNYDDIYTFDVDFSSDTFNVDNSKYTDFDFSNYNNVRAQLTLKQEKYLDDIVDMISKFVSKLVPYSIIESFLPLYQGIIFNVSQPKDIILHFDGTDYIPSFEATFLSVSFLENSYVQNALFIVRPFLTVIVVYSWLLSMRKKAVSMLGG